MRRNLVWKRLLFGLALIGATASALPASNALVAVQANAPSTANHGIFWTSDAMIAWEYGDAYTTTASERDGALDDSILCFDDHPEDATYCTIDVYEPGCGDLVASARQIGAGLQRVTARIPREAYAGNLLTEFCVVVGWNHQSPGGDVVELYVVGV